MDPYSSPFPNNSPHNPFPHSLLSTREFLQHCILLSRCLPVLYESNVCFMVGISNCKSQRLTPRLNHHSIAWLQSTRAKLSYWIIRHSIIKAPPLWALANLFGGRWFPFSCRAFLHTDLSPVVEPSRCRVQMLAPA